MKYFFRLAQVPEIRQHSFAPARLMSREAVVSYAVTQARHSSSFLFLSFCSYFEPMRAYSCSEDPVGSRDARQTPCCCVISSLPAKSRASSPLPDSVSEPGVSVAAGQQEAPSRSCQVVCRTRPADSSDLGFLQCPSLLP